MYNEPVYELHLVCVFFMFVYRKMNVMCSVCIDFVVYLLFVAIYLEYELDIHNAVPIEQYICTKYELHISIHITGRSTQ